MKIRKSEIKEERALRRRDKIARRGGGEKEEVDMTSVVEGGREMALEIMRRAWLRRVCVEMDDRREEESSEV